jgi:DNA-binding transcriptional MerR regulator
MSGKVLRPSQVWPNSARDAENFKEYGAFIRFSSKNPEFMVLIYRTPNQPETTWAVAFRPAPEGMEEKWLVNSYGVPDVPTKTISQLLKSRGVNPNAFTDEQLLSIYNEESGKYRDALIARERSRNMKVPPIATYFDCCSATKFCAHWPHNQLFSVSATDIAAPAVAPSSARHAQKFLESGPKNTNNDDDESENEDFDAIASIDETVGESYRKLGPKIEQLRVKTIREPPATKLLVQDVTMTLKLIFFNMEELNLRSLNVLKFRNQLLQSSDYGVEFYEEYIEAVTGLIDMAEMLETSCRTMRERINSLLAKTTPVVLLLQQIGTAVDDLKEALEKYRQHASNVRKFVEAELQQKSQDSEQKFLDSGPKNEAKKRKAMEGEEKWGVPADTEIKDANFQNEDFNVLANFQVSINGPQSALNNTVEPLFNLLLRMPEQDQEFATLLLSLIDLEKNATQKLISRYAVFVAHKNNLTDDADAEDAFYYDAVAYAKEMDDLARRVADWANAMVKGSKSFLFNLGLQSNRWQSDVRNAVLAQVNAINVAATSLDKNARTYAQSAFKVEKFLKEKLQQALDKARMYGDGMPRIDRIDRRGKVLEHAAVFYEREQAEEFLTYLKRRDVYGLENFKIASRYFPAGVPEAENRWEIASTKNPPASCPHAGLVGRTIAYFYTQYLKLDYLQFNRCAEDAQQQSESNFSMSGPRMRAPRMGSPTVGYAKEGETYRIYIAQPDRPQKGQVRWFDLIFTIDKFGREYFHEKLDDLEYFIVEKYGLRFLERNDGEKWPIDDEKSFFSDRTLKSLNPRLDEGPRIVQSSLAAAAAAASSSFSASNGRISFSPVNGWAEIGKWYDIVYYHTESGKNGHLIAQFVNDKENLDHFRDGNGVPYKLEYDEENLAIIFLKNLKSGEVWKVNKEESYPKGSLRQTDAPYKQATNVLPASHNFGKGENAAKRGAKYGEFYRIVYSSQNTGRKSLIAQFIIDEYNVGRFHDVTDKTATYTLFEFENGDVMLLKDNDETTERRKVIQELTFNPDGSLKEITIEEDVNATAIFGIKENDDKNFKFLMSAPNLAGSPGDAESNNDALFVEKTRADYRKNLMPVLLQEQTKATAEGEPTIQWEGFTAVKKKLYSDENFRNKFRSLKTEYLKTNFVYENAILLWEKIHRDWVSSLTKEQKKYFGY